MTVITFGLFPGPRARRAKGAPTATRAAALRKGPRAAPTPVRGHFPPWPRPRAACPPERRERALLEPVGDPPPLQVVGADLDLYPVTRQHPDPVHTHLARIVGQNLVPVVRLNPERSIFQRLDHCALKQDGLLLRIGIRQLLTSSTTDGRPEVGRAAARAPARCVTAQVYPAGPRGHPLAGVRPGLSAVGRHAGAARTVRAELRMRPCPAANRRSWGGVGVRPPSSC
jgi:hypothetical protein